MIWLALTLYLLPVAAERDALTAKLAKARGLLKEMASSGRSDFTRIRELVAALDADAPAPEVTVENIEPEDGFWRSCSGCHETNEGAETGCYPFSKTFQCYLGAGCGECGGLGAVWDNTDHSASPAPEVTVEEAARVLLETTNEATEADEKILNAIQAERAAEGIEGVDGDGPLFEFRAALRKLAGEKDDG